MLTKKPAVWCQHSIFFALFSFIGWTFSFLAVTAEDSHPSKLSTPDNNRIEQVSPSTKISSNTVRGYMNWIVRQTGWATADIPPIKITSLAHMSEMLLGPSSGLEGIIQPKALYSKNERLIYLAESWNKNDLLDQSIFVHELVHHLQVENHIQFECWGRYEAQAYELQIQWLRAQGVKDPYNLLHASRTAIESLAVCP